MSCVSNVILTARYVPHDRFDEIEALTHQRDGRPQPIGFVNVNKHAGGGKCWEADTFMAAVNYLDYPWEDPTTWMSELADILTDADGVVLVIHHEHHEDSVDVWQLVDGKWIDWEVEAIAENYRRRSERLARDAEG